MFQSRKALSPAEAMELGQSRETWCPVEMKKEQSWCRKERKHSDCILTSTVFGAQSQGPTPEPRCTFEVNAPTHLERKHYGQQCMYICNVTNGVYVPLMSNPSAVT